MQVPSESSCFCAPACRDTLRSYDFREGEERYAHATRVPLAVMYAWTSGRDLWNREALTAEREGLSSY